MNEEQLQFLMQIIREQMEDYLDKKLVKEICAGIEEGINDNMATFEEMAFSR